MTLYATASAQAITELLALPDPPEMPWRGFHPTCEGDPEVEAIKGYLRRCYEQHSLTAIESGDVQAPRLN